MNSNMRKMYTEKQIAKLVNEEVLNDNVSIGGNLSVIGDISGDSITGNSIIENMSGYEFTLPTTENITITPIYAGAVKNGNKLTLVVFAKANRSDSVDAGRAVFGRFYLPEDVMTKIYPYTFAGLNNVIFNSVEIFTRDNFSTVSSTVLGTKASNNQYIAFVVYDLNSLTANTDYLIRIEKTFLLSENLAS